MKMCWPERKAFWSRKKLGYPLYAAQVPPGKLYVERWPANKFILRFDYIYDMFHMTKLDFQFIRMYVLYLNYFIRVENIKYICVADPFYMHESFLAVCKEHRDYASKYLGEFMIANKDKEVILLPYHPTYVIRAYPFVSVNHSFASLEANLRCT